MGISIKAEVMETVNYVAAHIGVYGISLLKNIEIQGDGPQKIICRITSIPAFLYEYKEELDFTRKKAAITSPKLVLDDVYYRKELIEARDGEIKIEILDAENPETILGFNNFSVHIQPYLHWDAKNYYYTLPAYMQPNDPLVVGVLKKAGEYVAEMGTIMCGYQWGSGETVVKQANAIYKALEDLNLHYISPPPSFETVGQKIRIPHQVLHEESKQGTCLDLAILYATCLEAASLNALLVVIKGHAFAGVWTEDIGFGKSFIQESDMTEEIRQKMDRAFMPVECTTFTDGRGISFSQAVEVGKKNMKEFRYIIDVQDSRAIGVHPVYTYTDKPICRQQGHPTVDMSLANKENSKLERLKRQAMNISVGSKLLSGKKDNFEIRFPLSTADFIEKGYEKEALYLQMREYVLSGKMDEKEMDHKLHGIWMNEKEKQRESGQKSLYLALNFLRWKPEGRKGYCMAPLYLCPAEIYRNKRGEYLFEADRKQMRFNPVLKTMLMQDYNIDISDMKDMPGEEYQEQIHILRYRIERQEGWSVEEDQAQLALFTIPNEAIWTGISDERVLNHKIVNGILQGVMSWEDEKTPEEKQEDTIYAFQADNSQREVIGSSFRKKAQVVLGPAGNGKTQTIANIMTCAMKKGENVLFVSEKMSALNVVKDMIAETGSGAFCLEIIGGKDSPADVSQQIEKTLKYVEHHEKTSQTGSKAWKKYQEAEKAINTFYESMEKKSTCGMSLEELIEIYESYRDYPLILEIDSKSASLDLDEAVDEVETFADAIKILGIPQGKYLGYFRSQNTNRTMEERVARSVEEVLEAGDSLRRSVREFSNMLGISGGNSEKEWIQRICSYASILRACKEYGEDWNKIANTSSDPEEKIREEMLNTLKRLQREDFRTRRYNVAAEEMKKYLISLVGRNETRNLMQDMDTEEMERIIKQADLTEFLEDDSEEMRCLSAKRDFQVYENRVEDQIRNASEKEKACIKIAVQNIASGQKPEIKEKAIQLIQTYKIYSEKQSQTEKLNLWDLEKFTADHPDELKLVLFEEWKRSREDFHALEIFQNIMKKMQDAGLSDVAEQINENISQGRMSPNDAVPIFRKSWCKYQIDKICRKCPELQEFNLINYRRCIRQYNEKEQEIRKKIREELVSAQIDRLPDVREGAVNMQEVGKLNGLVRRRGRQPAIRTFFEETPHFLMNLYPCMIMNPSAVAEYIPLDFPEFDTVIIDEGSQMPTYKALIPIAHGKRCLIFGDEQQMPPTSFFKKQQEDEDGYAAPIESILEDAIATSMPRKMLKCHYRSEHESLIAFSNQKYYDNEIVTFPSCNTEMSGVSYEFVKDGCYDRGGKATNEPEARRVIEKVQEIYRQLPSNTEETLGILTLNVNQRDLIQNLLINAAMEDIDFGRKVDNLVSVVNLEACQGREWDNVVISTGYGKDKNGNFTVNMGPLNTAEGSSRLNVLLTRSRKRMYVVTSLMPEMFAKAERQGSRDLGDFLAYARGDLQFDTREMDSEKSGKGVADALAKELRKAGYEVHTNIGSSKCKVDIGVVSKTCKDKYVLGILLDHFKDSRIDIRDSEIIYPEALQRKGWNIYRLHALNWYEHPKHELKQIEKMIEKAEEV